MDLLVCLIFPLLSLFFFHTVIFLLRGLLDQTIEKLQAIIGSATMRSIPVSHTAPIDQVKLPIAKHESVMEVECLFCLSYIQEGEEIRELRCKHLFHRSCLDQWIMCRQRTCPLCRDTMILCNADEEEEEFDDSSVLLLACFCNSWRLW